ncbi:MAG: ABC transporter substrate-binding protein, partial [Acidimicrobiales bacterium]
MAELSEVRGGRLGRRSWTALTLIWVVAVAGCTSAESDGPVTAPAVTQSEGEGIADSTATAEPLPGVLWSIDGALVAGSNCAAPVTGQPLRIGYAADFGLIGADADIAGNEAVRHLAKLINCSGGVEGQPVEIVVADVGGRPVTAMEATEELLGMDPHAIIGPRLASSGLRLLQATGGRVPVVFATSTEPALADPSKASYLVGVDGAAAGRVAARFSIDQGWLTAATLTAPGPDFGYGPRSFAATFEAEGGTDIADIPFAVGGTEPFEEILDDLASGSPPDVIFSVMPKVRFAQLVGEARAAGIESAFINGDPFALAGLTPMPVDPGPTSSTGSAPLDPVDDRPAELAADLAGTYAVAQPIDTPGSRIRRLDESFRAATGSGSQNPAAAALAGDALTAIIEAYLCGGKGSPEATAQALSGNLVVDGVTGVFTYGGRGAPARPINIAQLVDDEVVSV